MKTLICTSNNYTRLIPAFAHLWRKYAGWDATLICETEAPMLMPPPLFTYYGAGAGLSWSARLIKYLQGIHEQTILLLLDDYFLTAPVNKAALNRAVILMRSNPYVHKIDLSGDRLDFAHSELDTHYVKSSVNAEYLTSTQAALWNRDFLLSCLRSHESIWDFELQGTQRLQGQQNLLILGQKQPSFVYQNVILKRNLIQWRCDKMPIEDVNELKQMDLWHGQ